MTSMTIPLHSDDHPNAEEEKNLSGPPVVPKVLLSGYYGFNNLGDELILGTLIQHLHAKGAEVSVLSANPQATQERHGVHAIDRNNIIDIINALSQSHLFISGGGGLFQDASSAMSPWYYAAMIALARYFEVPVCFWGQGVGPLHYPTTEWVTRMALKGCQHISVRDESSAQIVEHLTGKKPPVATDPVWLYDMPAPVEQFPHTDKSWLIGISLRPSPELTPARLWQFAECLKRFVEDSASTRPVQFLLLPFHPEGDTPVLTELENHLYKLNAGNFKIVEPHQVTDALQQCHVLFGMRFHSILLAALADVAVYGLIYDPKVRQLLKQLGLQGTDVAQLDKLDPETFVENLRQYFQRYPAPDLEPIRKQAKVNLDVLDQALEACMADLPVLL